MGSFAANFASFELESTQSVEDATPYGANVMAVNVGSGTPSMNLQVGAFAKQGATGTAPGMASALANQSCTITADTGCTETGSFVIRSVKLAHARMKGVVPLTWQMVNASEITEAWVVA